MTIVTSDPMFPVPPGAASPFRDSIRKVVPGWLLDYVGERYLWTIGVFQDAMADSMAYGMFARFPQSGISGILGPLGNDRQIDRAPTETDPVYAGRLKTFRTAWRGAGGPIALLNQIQAYFYPIVPTVRVVLSDSVPWPLENSVWYELSPTGVVTVTKTGVGNGFGWGDATNRWFVFYVVVGVEVPDTSLGAGTPPSWWQEINVVIKKWGRPGAFCKNGIHIIANSPPVFTPSTPTATSGNWDNPINRNNAVARYWDGPT